MLFLGESKAIFIEDTCFQRASFTDACTSEHAPRWRHSGSVVILLNHKSIALCLRGFSRFAALHDLLFHWRPLIVDKLSPHFTEESPGPARAVLLADGPVTQSLPGSGGCPWILRRIPPSPLPCRSSSSFSDPRRLSFIADVHV